uniref:Uncharacterized protein n=1 Tax=Helianthus annuus TaxID=4232 RepID=A0A251UKS1_HELAN
MPLGCLFSIADHCLRSLFPIIISVQHGNLASANETQLLARLQKLVDEVITYDQCIT